MNGVGEALGWWPLLQALLLVAAANTAPLAAGRLLPRADWPIDGGRPWLDGRPLLGRSKTWRGLASALLAGTAGALLLGLPAMLGLLAAMAAMAGDIAASFAKRRPGVPASGRSFGLDQLPESLLPLLALQPALGLSAAQVATGTLAFLALEPPLARLWFRLGWRDHPY